MRYDQGPPRAAPAHFPYRDHGTLADVWGSRTAPAPVPLVVQGTTPVFNRPPPAPIVVAPRPIPKPRPVERDLDLDQMSAERAFERFTRGDW